MRTAILLLIPGLMLAADVYQAPSPEPTPEETLILELMNRFRADPKAESQYIVKTFGSGERIFGADARMFLEECAGLGPVPPLVFNLQLLDAARKHSYYMVHNGLGHDEQPGKRGFTGASPGDRTKAAGYPGGAAENAFAGSSGPLNSHVRFIVDDGPGGTGGMQPGRGHRMNMIGRHREAGPGAVANGAGLSVTHNFGSRGGNRLAGGAVYIDLNGNGFYDVGEGKGGIQIVASDGSRATTWSSGAFAIELRSSTAVALKLDYHGSVHTREFTAGSDNVGFSIGLPQQVEFDIADGLLAAVAKEAVDSPARFKAQVALAMATGLLVDQPRRERMSASVGEVGSGLEAARHSVREAFDGDAATMRKLIAGHTKTYRGTAALAWFKEAELAHRANLSVKSYLQQASVAKPSPTMERDLLKSLEQARDGLQIGEFASRMGTLAAQVRGAGTGKS
jgi:hypothetical protein